MISKPTVFVLGAGASMPYGLPSGAALRGRICQATLDPGTNDLGNTLCSLGYLSVGEVSAFGHAFQHSGVPSVDSFLARNPQHAEIGKLSIAACLATLEHPNPIFNDGTEDHWYRLLWAAMIEDVSRAATLKSNLVRFITFNYDRSLEHFLHQSIRYTFNTTDAEATDLLKSVGIMHVYGLLGPYDHARRDGARAYGEALTAEKLQLAAKSIHVIAEDRGDKVFQMARTWFDWAERICFLGFGFDPLNVHRLGLEDVINYKSERNGRLPLIYTSAYGLTDAEISHLNVKVCGGRFANWTAIKDKNSMTLRQLALLMS